MHKRKEVLCTSSQNQQISARSILAERGIDYRVVITNSSGNQDSTPNEYRIFVYHKDYERASTLLRTRLA